MTTRSLMVTVALLGTLLITGCVTPPRIETPIHEDETGSIVLRTVPDASDRSSHPADVSVEALAKVLTGIHARRTAIRWLQRLLDSESESKPVFSPEQVAFWAPHLRQAFLRATPEERVFIRIPSVSEGRRLTGMLFLEQNDLHMALTLSNSSGRRPQSKTKPRPSDSLGVTESMVTFLPGHAVRKNPEPRHRGTPWRTHLIIDVARLTTLEETDLSKDGQNASSTPDATPSHAAPNVAPQSSSPERMSAPSPPDSQDLLEEIQSLRRELSRQQREIERLKQRTP